MPSLRITLSTACISLLALQACALFPRRPVFSKEQTAGAFSQLMGLDWAMSVREAREVLPGLKEETTGRLALEATRGPFSAVSNNFAREARRPENGGSGEPTERVFEPGS